MNNLFKNYYETYKKEKEATDKINIKRKGDIICVSGNFLLKNEEKFIMMLLMEIFIKIFVRSDMCDVSKEIEYQIIEVISEVSAMLIYDEINENDSIVE